MTTGSSSSGHWQVSDNGRPHLPSTCLPAGPATFASCSTHTNRWAAPIGTSHADGTNRTQCARDPAKRAVPDTCPEGHSQSAFPLVRSVQSNLLRSRERRFESCRGHSNVASEVCPLSCPNTNLPVLLRRHAPARLLSHATPDLPKPITAAAPPRRESARRGLDPIPRQTGRTRPCKTP